MYMLTLAEESSKKVVLIVVIIAIVAVATWFFYDDVFVRLLPEEELTAELNDISGFLISLQEDCGPLLERLESLSKSNSDSPDVWRLKGICEFNVEDYDGAKKSFEKVLEIDPENEPAKNYLALIGNIEVGATRIIPSRDNIDRDFMESKIIVFDSNIFDYSGGNLLPTDESDVLRFAGSYFSNLSFSNTTNYVASTLDEEGIEYEVSSVSSDDRTTTIFNIVSERLEDGRPFGFSISIQATNPVDVSVFYENRE